MIDANKLPDADWGGLNAWAGTLRVSDKLAAPVRLLWQDYRAFAEEDGFPVASVFTFMRRLRLIEGVNIHERDTGRIRRMVVGAAPGNWRN